MNLEALRKRHVLYRAYDESGALLYLGVTADFNKRQQQHRHTSPWFADAVRWDVRPTSPHWGEALTAERRAIVAERPLHNSSAHKVAPKAVA